MRFVFQSVLFQLGPYSRFWDLVQRSNSQLPLIEFAVRRLGFLLQNVSAGEVHRRLYVYVLYIQGDNGDLRLMTHSS